jgi:hypothetical protein
VKAFAELAACLTLGSLLREVRERYGDFDLVDHWKQGEFHHDVVLRIPNGPDSPCRFLVVATNCNGGIKEVLGFDECPSRLALWHQRCPENREFAGELPVIKGIARTHHWFDPCELLTPDARSELRPEFRRRQRGGGWEPTEQ